MKNIDSTILLAKGLLHELTCIRMNMKEIERTKWMIEQAHSAISKDDFLLVIEQLEQENKNHEATMIEKLHAILEPVINQ